MRGTSIVCVLQELAHDLITGVVVEIAADLVCDRCDRTLGLSPWLTRHSGCTAADVSMCCCLSSCRAHQCVEQLLPSLQSGKCVSAADDSALVAVIDMPVSGPGPG
eukprot:m.213680 g.213680  ORF g.213680 m.213680 type:complete len:106 (-) comp25565_c0_seq3:171-488(-)